MVYPHKAYVVSTKPSSPSLALVNRNTQLSLCTKLVARRWQMSQGRGAGHEGCDGSEMILSSATQCDVWTMAREGKGLLDAHIRGKGWQAREEASAKTLC